MGDFKTALQKQLNEVAKYDGYTVVDNDTTRDLHHNELLEGYTERYRRNWKYQIRVWSKVRKELLAIAAFKGDILLDQREAEYMTCINNDRVFEGFHVLYGALEHLKSFKHEKRGV